MGHVMFDYVPHNVHYRLILRDRQWLPGAKGDGEQKAMADGSKVAFGDGEMF